MNGQENSVQDIGKKSTCNAKKVNSIPPLVMQKNIPRAKQIHHVLVAYTWKYSIRKRLITEIWKESHPHPQVKKGQPPVFLLPPGFAFPLHALGHQPLADIFAKWSEQIRFFRPIYHWVIYKEVTNWTSQIVWKLQNGLKFSGPPKNTAPPTSINWPLSKENMDNPVSILEVVYTTNRRYIYTDSWDQIRSGYPNLRSIQCNTLSSTISFRLVTIQVYIFSSLIFFFFSPH